LAERLELHRLRCGNPQTGPIFANSLGKRVSINNLLNRAILPVLNRCATCHQSDGKEHLKQEHDFVLDASLPEWHGWHACGRGLGSNLYRLGIPDKVIQLILRHSDVATTLGYYVKPTARMQQQQWRNLSALASADVCGLVDVAVLPSISSPLSH
jgi:hypothetical protein